MTKLSELISKRSEELTNEYSLFFQENFRDSGSDIGVPSLPVVVPDKFYHDFVDPVVFGVEIDTDDVTIPYGLYEIGLIAKTEDGALSEATLDAAINMVLSEVQVLLEIEPDTQISDFKHLVSTASAIKVSLSFLPPDCNDAAAFQAYCTRLEAATAAYLQHPNMVQFVLPVSSYIHYMYLENYFPETAKDFQPDDPYIIERFHHAMTVEQADAMKARIRKVVIAHFGGEQGFQEFCDEMFASLDEAVTVNIIEEAARISIAKSSEQGDNSVSE